METIEIYSHCPECKSSIVDDIPNGERICSSCGIVVAEQMADYGQEAKTNNLEDKMKLAREQDKQHLHSMIWELLLKSLWAQLILVVKKLIHRLQTKCKT